MLALTPTTGFMCYISSYCHARCLRIEPKSLKQKKWSCIYVYSARPPGLLNYYYSYCNVKSLSSTYMHAPNKLEKKLHCTIYSVTYILTSISSASHNPLIVARTLIHPITNDRIPITPLNPILTRRQMAG